MRVAAQNGPQCLAVQPKGWVAPSHWGGRGSIFAPGPYGAHKAGDSRPWSHMQTCRHTRDDVPWRPSHSPLAPCPFPACRCCVRRQWRLGTPPQGCTWCQSAQCGSPAAVADGDGRQNGGRQAETVGGWVSRSAAGSGGSQHRRHQQRHPSRSLRQQWPADVHTKLHDGSNLPLLLPACSGMPRLRRPGSPAARAAQCAGR